MPNLHKRVRDRFGIYPGIRIAKTIRIIFLYSYRLAWMLLSQLYFRLEVPWCAIGRGTSFVNDRLYGYVRNSCTLCNAVAARIADSVLESKPQHRIFFFTDHNRHILSVRRRTELCSL